MSLTSPRSLRTTFGSFIDRSMPPRVAGDVAKAAEASGVVDSLIFWDQLTSWWPRALWTRDFTPLAEAASDCDSFADPFVLAGVAGAAAPSLGLTLTTDAIRRGPAEMMQSMLTLANLTDETATLWLGAGEVKQTAPFGYRRAEGLDRLEDEFQLLQALWDCDGPIDFDGKILKFRQAWVGGVRPGRARVYGMGGGPRFLDMLPKYADGWVTAVPAAAPTPEAFAAMVKRLKDAVEKEGRDPDAFGIAIWGMNMLHENPEVIERAKRNPLFQWLAAIGGRLDPDEWVREGFTPPFAKGWHYATKLRPAEMSLEECLAVAEKATPEMVEAGLWCGSPKEVAARYQDYIDAGADEVCVCDFMSLALPLEEAMSAVNRSLEIYRILKNA